MENKKKILFILGFFLALLFIINISAVCCEKTTTGFSCQNVEDVSECDTSNGLRTDSTSCEATTYCSVGTCIDSQDGLCFDSPQTTCNEDFEGYWSPEYQEDVPECQVGCCILGEQTAFVTPTRCTYLASQRGSNISPDFVSNIQSSEACNLLANPSEKGACVYESEFGRKCTIETREVCQESGKEFHGGLLCSAEELGTLCGPSERTGCVEDKEEVYFYDSCGNVANIYDSTKATDQNYWTYIQKWEDSCVLDMDNPNSIKSCGNCGYSPPVGSVCGSYRIGKDENPNIGDYVCRDLSCEYNGKKYSHGESWCATPDNWKDYMPGREEIRLICSNGEVTSDPCNPFRNSLCKQEPLYSDNSDDGVYLTAGCVLNAWESCGKQTTKDDCEVEEYDCQWLESETYNMFNGEEKGICAPKYAPGFDFWNPSSDTRDACQQVSVECNVKYKKPLGGDWEVDGDKTCLQDGNGAKKKIISSWAEDMQNVCSSFGDCGVKTNYINIDGYYHWGDLFSGKVKKSSIPNVESHGGGENAWWLNTNRDFNYEN